MSLSLTVLFWLTREYVVNMREAIDYLKTDYAGSIPHFDSRKKLKSEELGGFNTVSNLADFKEDYEIIKKLKQELNKTEKEISDITKDKAVLETEIETIKEKGILVKEEINAISEKFKSYGFAG